MKSYKKKFLAVLALFLLFPLAFVQEGARAQQFMAPRISGFDVDQVRQLAAGTELNFTLYGTPGGIATISIPGAVRRFLLEEVEMGLYEGTYTIKSRDRIATGASITANLRLGNQVASAVLDEPLVSKTPGRRICVAV